VSWPLTQGFHIVKGVAMFQSSLILASAPSFLFGSEDIFEFTQTYQRWQSRQQLMSNSRSCKFSKFVFLISVKTSILV
jgi:hypothetical protein